MAPPSPEAPWVPGHSLKSSKFLQALKNSHRKSLLPEAPFSLFLLCPFLGTLGILGINFSMSYLQTGPLWKSSLTPRVTVLYPFLSFFQSDCCYFNYFIFARLLSVCPTGSSASCGKGQVCLTRGPLPSTLPTMLYTLNACLFRAGGSELGHQTSHVSVAAGANSRGCCLGALGLLRGDPHFGLCWLLVWKSV